jgi:hypothetical protein
MSTLSDPRPLGFGPDRESGLIGLTRAGKTLVEAIINTEIG